MRIYKEAFASFTFRLFHSFTIPFFLTFHVPVMCLITLFMRTFSIIFKILIEKYFWKSLVLFLYLSEFAKCSETRNTGLHFFRNKVEEFSKTKANLSLYNGSNGRSSLLFKTIPFIYIRRKNAMIQRKIKQHSLEIQNKIKQLRTDGVPPAGQDLLKVRPCFKFTYPFDN